VHETPFRVSGRPQAVATEPGRPRVPRYKTPRERVS
jgi:hypothetical protein